MLGRGREAASRRVLDCTLLLPQLIVCRNVSSTPHCATGVPIGHHARYVRIETVEHPGWVAWSGIKVHGSEA